MAQTQANRDDRIELRTTRAEKRLLTAAAAHERLDVTSFIMRAVLPAARDVVEKAERISLSERDSLRVLDLLENPPAPTPALLAAARRRIAARLSASSRSVSRAWSEDRGPLRGPRRARRGRHGRRLPLS